MEIYLAFHNTFYALLRAAGAVAWSEIYEAVWPVDFNKKWIPLAPSEDEACRSLRESRAYNQNEDAWILHVTIPPDTWAEWEQNSTVVRNPGPTRTGDMYTDKVDHFLYGRTSLDQPHPFFRFDEYNHDWTPVTIPP